MNKTRNKRNMILAVLLAIAVMSAVLAGCAGQQAVAETGEAPKPTAAAPTPEPEGVEAVFGKQITVTLFSGAGEDVSKLFIEGAQAEAKALGATLEAAQGESLTDALSAAEGKADAFIAYLPEPADYAALESAPVPVAVYGIEKASVSENVSQVYYSPGNEVELALNAALDYPPHDTPVRLILMFESADSASFTAYQKLRDEGKIFPKEVYIASEAAGVTAGDWLKDKLNSYAEGMLDGVYAEDAGLALGALDALEALSRTDMEVFCPGVTAETTARMAKNPDVFAQAAGADEYLAGALCVRASLKAVKGEGAVTQELTPCVIDAAGLAKGGDAALIEMGGEQSKLLNESWMDTLRSYYETIPN